MTVCSSNAPADLGYHTALHTPGPTSSDALLQDDGDGAPWHGRTSPSPSSDRLVDSAPQSRSSWPLGVKTGLYLVAAVLILNAAITLWASINFPVEDGLGTLYRGTCGQVEQTGFGVHILVNIVATLLLGASNYTMQCLTSPTRTEIDAHHRKKLWLEVGHLSVRNLRATDKRRLLLWILLGASSFPLHLLFAPTPFLHSTACTD
jgi:hypothetical protein